MIAACLLNAMNFIRYLVTATSVPYSNPGLYIGASLSLLLFYPAYLYTRYFCSDQLERRNKLPQAQGTFTVLLLALFIWHLVDPYVTTEAAPGETDFNDTYTIVGCILLALTLAVNVYFFMVTRRYAALYPDNSVYDVNEVSKIDLVNNTHLKALIRKDFTNLRRRYIFCLMFLVLPPLLSWLALFVFTDALELD